MTANRRDLLVSSGAVLAGLSGCFGEERPEGSGESGAGNDSDPDAPERLGHPDVDADFRVGFRQPGIETAAWTSVDETVSESRTQGIAYDDGRLYVAGTEEGSHSTVYEFRRDGSYTGRSHTFGDGGHVNCLQWHDGRLWAMGFTAGEVYQTDFETETVLGSFEYGNGTVLAESPNNFVVVPREDGSHRMVTAAGFGSAAGHVIDHESAIEDGTAAGNVDARIEIGPFANTDGAHYRDGDAYFTNYPGTNSRGAAFKVSLPAPDRMDDGHRIGADDVEWYHAFETWADGGHVQDLTYDGDEGSWYLVADDDEQTIYRGPERTHATVPKAWSAWDAVESDRYGNSLLVDSREGTRSLPVFAAPRSDVLVVVPVYDDGAAGETQVAVGVGDGTGSRVQLGVNTANGDANYSLWDGDWSDTGVSRISESWVLFGFYAAEGAISMLVSADGGRTWEDAGESATAEAVAELALSSFEVDGTGFEVGPFGIDVGPDGDGVSQVRSP